MCGLLCLISKKQTLFSSQEVSLFTQLLNIDTIRGKDSTGVFSVTEQNNLNSLKTNLDGYSFTRTKEYEDFEKNALYAKVLVGHNRYATKGNITEQNAHPFIKDHICLVHNGTIWSHRHLANVDVDSEAITHALAESDPEDVLNKINGAYALIWYNIKEKKLYLTRNKERPLWIIQAKDFDLIGSEPKMLEWLYYRTYNKEVTASYFDIDTLYIYDCTKLEDSFEEIKVKKKIPSYQPYSIPTSISTGYMNNYNNDKTVCYKNYYYRDSISFLVKEIKIHSKYNISIIGTIETDPLVEIKGFFTGTEIDTKEFLDSKFIKGNISGKHVDNKNKTTIYVSDIKSIPYIQDITGKYHPYDKNCICTTCKKEITLNETKHILITYRKNKSINIKCSSCIKQHPFLLQQIEKTYGHV